jgi:adenylate cyclase
MGKFLNRIKRQVPVVGLTLLVTIVFLFHTSGAFQWRFVEQLENLLYDTRIKITLPGGIDKRIVIVDIDESSLSEIGRWPWGRDHVASMVDQLFDFYQIQLLGFDIVFSEPDDSSGLSILEKLGRDELSDIYAFQQKVDELRQRLDYDFVFRNSIFERQIVLGYYFQLLASEEGASENGILPLSVLSKKDFSKNNKMFTRSAPGYNANLPMLQEVAVGGGHFNPWIDEDGVVRRVPLLIEYESKYYESLALAMARKILDIDLIEPVFEEALGNSSYPALEWLKLGNIRIPVDQFIQALVPFRGGQRSFSYVSAADVIYGRADKSLLEDAIVLVGTTAPGLYDLRAVPMEKQYAGVEIHANLLAGIIDETIKKKPAYT